MTTYSYVTDRVETAAGVNAVNLASSDAVYVAQGTNVSASGSLASGIKGVDYNHVVVAGDVFGGFVGIYMTGSNGGDVITIAKDAGVASTSYAIYLYGTNDIVSNGGTISGYYGVSLVGGNGLVHNDGLIQSGFLAVSLGGTDATTNRLVNTGDILGGSYAFYGSIGADTVINKGLMVGALTFGAGNDFLDSRGGDLVGQIDLGVGNDTALGGDGADSIYGGDNDDLIKGRLDDDRLDGGDGMDKLRGGDGEDTFVFSTALSATNVDTIADFVHGEDQIGLNATIFAALGADVSASEFLSTFSGHNAFNNNQHIIYDRSKGTLWYDADGHGGTAAIKFAQLGTSSNHPTNIDFHDFAIV